MSSQGTTVYSGSFHHTLDDKNRITIPSAWRYVHGENDEFLAIPQTDGSIAVIPPDTVARIREKKRQIPVSNLAAQQALTRFFSRAHTCTFDKQGRVALTDAHRAHAKITKDVILAGSGDNFVIYSPAHWEQVTQPRPDDAAILAQLGI